jgi:3-isopropylmalate dehydrogenase
MLAAAMMLEWLEMQKGMKNGKAAARDLENAIRMTLQEGKKTRDLGGELGTEEFTQEVIRKL